MSMKVNKSVFTKKQLEEIEVEAIKAINRYYLVPDNESVGACSLCKLSAYCETCPFYLVYEDVSCNSITWRDNIGISSRLGYRSSDKAAWQKELKRRYNSWAKRNGVEPLVWEGKK